MKTIVSSSLRFPGNIKIILLILFLIIILLTILFLIIIFNSYKYYLEYIKEEDIYKKDEITYIYENNNNKTKEINNFIPYKKCITDHYFFDKDEIVELKKMLINFKNFCKKEDIQYFLISGSLIGSVRNGGLIPWDDDIDIGILKKDAYKLKKYVDKNYFIEKLFTYNFGYKLKILKPKLKRDIFIDIMIFEWENGKYSIINNNFPNEYFLEDELFPLIPHHFSGIDIFIPNKYNIHLDRAFKDWEKIAYINHTHFSLNDKEKIKMKKRRVILTNNNKKIYNCYI